MTTDLNYLRDQIELLAVSSYPSISPIQLQGVLQVMNNQVQRHEQEIKAQQEITRSLALNVDQVISTLEWLVGLAGGRPIMEPTTTEVPLAARVKEPIKVRIDRSSPLGLTGIKPGPVVPSSQCVHDWMSIVPPYTLNQWCVRCGALKLNESILVPDAHLPPSTSAKQDSTPSAPDKDPVQSGSNRCTSTFQGSRCWRLTGHLGDHNFGPLTMDSESGPATWGID